MLVVCLPAPSIAKRVHRLSVRPGKERGVPDHLVELKHAIPTEEAEEVVDSWDLEIVQNEQSARFEMRIQEVVFEVGKGVGVGTIEQDELKLLAKTMLLQHDLRGAFDEGYYLSP